MSDVMTEVAPIDTSMMSNQFPTTLQVVRAVSRVTLQELLKDKILYNIVLVGLGIFAIAVLASHLTFINPDRVVVDVVVTAINLSSSMIAVFASATTLNREFERRTIYVALSRPISRPQFVLGKFLGVVSMLFLNWVLLCIAFFLTFLFFSNMPLQQIGQIWGPTVSAALVLLLVQSWVLAAFSIMFASYSSTVIAVLFSVGLYLIGNSVAQIKVFVAQGAIGAVGGLVKAIVDVLPDFDHFNLGQRVTYGLPVSASFMLTSLIYGLCWIVVALIGASFLIRTKEDQ